jgi:NodT family efflux transporter outer membrane factor (OMF) lipoprotein
MNAEPCNSEGYGRASQAARRPGDWFRHAFGVAPILSIVAVALAFSAASCKVGPNFVTPQAKVAGQWMPTRAITNRPVGLAESFWWRSFEDPTLNELVETAYSNNPSLQIAGVRVLETRASLNKTIGELFPQQQNISGQVGYSRERGVDATSAEILFGAAWEIDFWGKYRRGIESDRASYLSSIADYDDALVTLIADVASSYVNIRTLEERLRVAQENLEIQRESLRIADAQFTGGETSERDVQQARTQLYQTESQIPKLELTLTQTKNSLAVLLGDTPDEVDRRLVGPGRIPVAPSAVVAGIPRDLLRRRPDVRSAGLAAASKSALIGVARAQMYPAFSLSGEFGVNGNNNGPNSLVDMFSWESRAVNAGAGMVFPIFNYGRLVNQVRVQDAQFQEAVLNYQKTVLAAQQEVEDGLVSFANQQRAVALLRQAAGAARSSTDLARIQYEGGETDFTTVLTAQQSQLTVEDSLASTQGNVVLGIISVYRALGGGWELRDGRDVISDEVKLEMSRRTDWGKLLEPSRHLPGNPARGDAAEPRGGN